MCKNCCTNKYTLCLIFFSVLELGYTCASCFRTYRHKRSLRRHEKFDCGKEPQFSCATCGKKAYQKVNLKSHVCKARSDLMPGKFDIIRQ